MPLINIDKARYRKHLNFVIVGCIVVLIVGSLGVSQTLIAWFPDESGSHFHWNVFGVVLSCIGLAFCLNKYRYHPFMTEVVYVWELKKSLNKIYRKSSKLKLAAQEGDKEALLALQYFYHGSRLLWLLDDNTIVMEELSKDQIALEALITKFEVDLDVADYDPNTLKRF